MLLHPGILALVLGSGIVLIMLSAAAVLGLRIALRWDIQSGSETQLSLERKTYLVSTLVQYALVFEVISLFLFIHTADDLRNILVGAMCATGSLNTNIYGFPALYAKITVLFLSAAWIALHSLDSRAEDYPLTKFKYKLLTVIVPVVFCASFLQLEYFLNIDPNVITSCCGVLFSEGGEGVGSSLASLPIRETRLIFYLFFVLVVASGLVALKNRKRGAVILLSILSALFFPVAIASIISFISLYFYQIPTHHCPFDILQRGYYFVGYPLYAALFFGVFFGVMTGAIEPFRKIASLSGIVSEVQRRWIVYTICGIIIFVIITLVPVVTTSFTLEGN